MGCVSSKQTVSVTPAIDHSGAFNSGRLPVGPEIEKSSLKKNGSSHKKNGELSDFGESGRANSNGESLSFRFRNLNKYIEGEQVAAGWPGWLSAVAGEAIQGWVPLKADAFEKLEKIGQGTYSSVFRAREIETERIVALKKVRFDNFEPESVRFMAREILILRRLNHPNIMKLDGLITSRLSCSIYLVFEYMEHDITGLLSCPNAKFSESQIKCYMKQLLSGIDHCHSKGVMHRDIKGSNLLVNDEGILKVGDFGLANFCPSGNRQPLTSRVVTLWYRPPELLLGSTDYDTSVDLWSVGCVFAELLLGNPVLQGRTEVEQLHKIFKLCGSPPNEYWKKSKLPHATLFKPQQPYDISLHETFKDVSTSAVDLIKTLLSVEPYKRGTASAALTSEYFTTKPCACEPSSLPKYPPSKEIDAKNREEAKRKNPSGRNRTAETRKSTRQTGGLPKLNVAPQVQGTKTNAASNVQIPKGGLSRPGGEARVASLDKLEVEKLEGVFHVKNASQGDIPFSGPLQVSSSSGFAWAKRRKDNASIPFTRCRDNQDVTCVISKQDLQKKWSQLERPDSFDDSEYHSTELSVALYQKEEMESKRNDMGYRDRGGMVDFSGPLLCQTHTVDELLERHERHIRQAVRMSWFQRGKKHGR